MWQVVLDYFQCYPEVNNFRNWVWKYLLLCPLFFSAPLGPETKPHNLVPTVKIYCPDSFFESDLKNLSSLFQKMKIFFVQSALKFLHCSALVR